MQSVQARAAPLWRAAGIRYEVLRARLYVFGIRLIGILCSYVLRFRYHLIFGFSYQIYL